jgi:hypothetical protein
MRRIDREKLFPGLTEHQFSQEPLNNHVFYLAKAIILEYIRIKRFYIVKKYNTDKDTGIRKKLSRLLIFKHV